NDVHLAFCFARNPKNSEKRFERPAFMELLGGEPPPEVSQLVNEIRGTRSVSRALKPPFEELIQSLVHLRWCALVPMGHACANEPHRMPTQVARSGGIQRVTQAISRSELQSSQPVVDHKVLRQ